MASSSNNSTPTNATTLIHSTDVPFNVVPLRNWELAYRSVVGSFAILINLVVLITVSVSSQLHAPRHLYWAAVSLTYLSMVVQWFFEMAGIYGGSWIACQLYSTCATVHHTANSVYFMLAACDRLIAIKRYEWYKNCVTTKRVALTLPIVYVVTCAIVTSPFWLGHITPSHCTINLTHMHCVMGVNLIIGFASLCLQVVIFIDSRKLLRCYLKSKAAAFKLGTYYSSGGGDRNKKLAGLQQNGKRNDSTALYRQKRTRQKYQKLNGLELKAALCLSINIMPMWISQIPLATNTFVLYWYLKYEKDVSLVLNLNVWLKSVYYGFIAYNPLVFVFTSKEFCRAFIRLSRKL